MLAKLQVKQRDALVQYLTVVCGCASAVCDVLVQYLTVVCWCEFVPNHGVTVNSQLQRIEIAGQRCSVNGHLITTKHIDTSRGVVPDRRVTIHTFTDTHTHRHTHIHTDTHTA